MIPACTIYSTNYDDGNDLTSITAAANVPVPEECATLFAVQPTWDLQTANTFLTEIGTVDPTTIRQFYADQWPKSAATLKFIGVAAIDDQFLVYKNMVHMLDFADPRRIPMTIHFSLEVPPASYSKNPLWPQPDLDDSVLKVEAPFLIASAASGQDLVTYYQHPTKGWCAVLANTYGQPVFIAFTKNLPEVRLAYTAYTRHDASQLPVPHDDCIVDHIPVRIIDRDAINIVRHAELAERVMHKMALRFISHVTLPGTIDLDGRRHVADKQFRSQWDAFASSICVNSQYLPFRTTPNGMQQSDQPYTHHLIGQAPPKHRAGLAVILDYIQDITVDQVLDFINCCWKRKLLFPPPSISLLAYGGHVNVCHARSLKTQVKAGPVPTSFAHASKAPSMVSILTKVKRPAPCPNAAVFATAAQYNTHGSAMLLMLKQHKRSNGPSAPQLQETVVESSLDSNWDSPPTESTPLSTESSLSSSPGTQPTRPDDSPDSSSGATADHGDGKSLTALPSFRPPSSTIDDLLTLIAATYDKMPSETTSPSSSPTASGPPPPLTPAPMPSSRSSRTEDIIKLAELFVSMLETHVDTRPPPVTTGRKSRMSMHDRELASRRRSMERPPPATTGRYDRPSPSDRDRSQRCAIRSRSSPRTGLNRRRSISPDYRPRRTPTIVDTGSIPRRHVTNRNGIRRPVLNGPEWINLTDLMRYPERYIPPPPPNANRRYYKDFGL
jgi:hypothetical protein